MNVFRPMSDLPTVNELIDGINYYLKEAEKLGLTPYVGTLLPIYGWRTYASFREELKNDFNSWIISNQNSIDFGCEIGDLINGEYHFKDKCDSGDHLHPSKYAYDLMGKLAAKKIYN